MFDERCDDELVALAGSDVKGRVSVLVLTINVSAYTQQHAVTRCEQQLHRTEEQQKSSHRSG